MDPCSALVPGQRLNVHQYWSNSYAIRSATPCHSLSICHAKNTKSKSSAAAGTSPSSVHALIGWITPGARPSSMESSIEAALILTDKKRQVEWKNDMRQQFPLVPAFAIDACIDSLSDAFASVAPAQVKAALRPGGLEKVRPGLEATIVSKLENQTVMKSIPLKTGDKRQFLHYLVNMSLDYVLKDAELLLAKPAVKLQALEVQKQNIRKLMTFRQLAWYQIQYAPVQTALLVFSSIYIVCSLYQQTKHTWIVSSAAGIIAGTISQFQLLMKKLIKMLGLHSSTFVKRRASFRALRR